jgi:hypothetical protein
VVYEVSAITCANGEELLQVPLQLTESFTAHILAGAPRPRPLHLGFGWLGCWLQAVGGAASYLPTPELDPRNHMKRLRMPPSSLHMSQHD